MSCRIEEITVWRNHSASVTMAEEDLFNKTNFNLALFLKLIDALHVS